MKQMIIYFIIIRQKEFSILTYLKRHSESHFRLFRYGGFAIERSLTSKYIFELWKIILAEPALLSF